MTNLIRDGAVSTTVAKQSRIYYISGGTTGIPKTIEYTPERFAQSVRVKSRILHSCGVSAGSRILVMHPMAPWSIGQIFTDGALALGAKVMPIGITLRPTTLAHLIKTFDPTTICCGARNLLRVVADLGDEARDQLRRSLDLVLTAGEMLSDSVRMAIERDFSCVVRDIYGCAELDALGVELSLAGELDLVPDYNYRIRKDDVTRPAAPGISGVLEVEHPLAGGYWHSTNDVVLVVDRKDEQSWSAPRILIQGRTDIRAKFADGCAIGSEQLIQVQSELGLSAIQLLVDRSRDGERVKLLYSNATDAEISSERVCESLMQFSTDFADAVQAGCIRELSVLQVQDSDGFLETERGKRPIIVVHDDSDVNSPLNASTI